ncbi:hypothetical protein KTH11_18975, partial [Acinetobacter baumannii]|nr:hypothetical protein [Acinetobacter baumannii]
TQLNLDLPESIKPQPQQFSTYAPLVNDLGADEMKGGISQTYEVRLRPAALPKIDESLLIGTGVGGAVNTPPKVVAPATNSTTRTTIIRRDAEGNVVDVHQSNSAADAAKRVQQNRATEASTKNATNEGTRGN